MRDWRLRGGHSVAIVSPMPADRIPLTPTQRAAVRAVHRGRGGTVPTRTMDVLKRRDLVEWSARTRAYTLTPAGEREHARITSGR